MWMGELLSAAGVVDRTGVGGEWGRADLERAEYYRGTRSATVSRSSRTSMEGRRQEFAALSVMVPSFLPPSSPTWMTLSPGKPLPPGTSAPPLPGLSGDKRHWVQISLLLSLTPLSLSPSYTGQGKMVGLLSFRLSRYRLYSYGCETRSTHARTHKDRGE